MAVLAIEISRKGRKNLCITVLFLNFSMALINFIVFVVGIVVAVLFNQQRDMLKDFGYGKLNFLIIFTSLVLVAFHLFGAKLTFDCINTETRERFKKFEKIYLNLIFVAVVLLVTVSICTSSAIYQLSKGYEKGFKEVMEEYDTDKDKRMEIDLLQYRNKCCGSKGYKDWIEMAWYPDDFMRPEMRGRKERGVPFTCCNPEYMGPCLHDAGGKARPGYKKAEESFYSDGCAEVITVNLRWVLGNLSLWLILPIFLEFFVLLAMKYLLTSVGSAEQSGDEEGPGLGYLMQKCPCTCLEFLERTIAMKKAKA